MRFRRLFPIFGVLAVTAVTACADMLNPDTVAEPAFLFYFGNSTRIEAPDTVARDTPFTVQFRTYGGGCIHKVARTDVRIVGNLVELRPFNERFTSGSCTADLRYLDHTASVRIPSAGAATLRVIGVQEGVGGNTGRTPAELSRTIVVR